MKVLIAIIIILQLLTMHMVYKVFSDIDFINYRITISSNQIIEGNYYTQQYVKELLEK